MFNVAAVRTKAPAVPVGLARFLSVKIYYRKKDGDFCQIGSVNALFLRKALNFCSIYRVSTNERNAFDFE